MTKLLALMVGLGLLLACFGCSKYASQTDTSKQSPSSANKLPGQQGWEPREACGYLSDKLKPGLYRNEGGNVFGCLSTAKNLGAGTPLPNNIVYRVRGDALLARQAELILNINNPESANDGHKTLLEYSQELSLKALGVPLSQSATKAIMGGNHGRGKVDTTKVEVLRHDFSNGRGYELHYIITPRL